MKNIYHCNCQLTKGFTEEEVTQMFDTINCSVQEYGKGNVIAIEGDDCSSIGIVMEGEVEIQKTYPSGKIITVDRLRKGQMFGEVIVFSNVHKYPSTIIASEKAKVLFISKENIVKICHSNHKALNNLMGILSNKILMLNKKIKNLSYNSIRQKVSSFLLEEYKKQNNLVLNLPLSRKEMAEELGIPRPSLSRELINLKEEGVIDFEKNTISILDLEALENFMFD